MDVSGSSHYVHGNRPASISELATRAQDIFWDPNKGLKHWLRTAEKARRTAEQLVKDGDYENAFVNYAKAATVVLEKIPTHRDYSVLLTPDQRKNLDMNGQDILDSMSRLKPLLVDRYEQWHGQRSSTSGSNRSSVPSSSQDERRGQERRSRDSSRRRREDLQEERARNALEAARREQEWQRTEQARRQQIERTQYTKEDEERARQHEAEARRRDEAAAAAQRERARKDAEARQEEERRSLLDEKRRQEQEGIMRRQQEAEAAALAARMEVATRLSPSTITPIPSHQVIAQEAMTRSIPAAFPVVAPQPTHATNSSRYSGSFSSSVMPLENPLRNDDDSSTDAEGVDRQQPWIRQRSPNQTPTKSRQYAPGISYPPPITTTSPPPPELGHVRYPSLMSQHQLKQGYVPSLQSMFSSSSIATPQDSSLLFESKGPGDLYSNILPNPSNPIVDPVVPPYPGRYHTPESSGRSSAVSYSSSGHNMSSRNSFTPSSQGPPTAPRIVPSTSVDTSIRELKTVRLPRECLPRFVSIARVNTLQNRETCGLLLGKDKGSKYVVTTLLIPKQHSTSDTCTMDEEELVLQFTEERHLITLGWIHTHPTQSCFMSSVDLHTHSGFQRMLPESFAVVCAPSSTPTFGIFRLTDPGGLQTILDCTIKEAFHPHKEVPVYTDCDNSHVQLKEMPLEIVDLR